MKKIYSKKDIEKYCEDNFLDDSFKEKLETFIKNEMVEVLDVVTLPSEKGELVIKVELTEV